jgi:tripartite-type tricarboxylate transporter receptor subunit TctC
VSPLKVSRHGLHRVHRKSQKNEITEPLSLCCFSFRPGERLSAVAALPERPIKFILGFGIGGPTDIIARTLTERLSKDPGQSVIVQNETGASRRLS